MIESVRQAAPGASVEGVSVQQMAAPGTEVIIGTTTDAQFGPVMMFGLGGIFVEVMKDVAFRIVPLEPRDAKQIVREIKATRCSKASAVSPGPTSRRWSG